MPKTAEPMTFEHIGRNLYRTASRSNAGQFYNVRVISDGWAQCHCYAGTRKGWNGCAHAKALVEQGLATFEPEIHTAALRDDVPGTNYFIECSCGYTCAIATLNREYAEEAYEAHVNPPKPRSLF